MATTSSGLPDAFTYQYRTVSSHEYVPIEATPESVVLKQSQLVEGSDCSSYGINSAMTIDLNSMPVYCSSLSLPLPLPLPLSTSSLEMKSAEDAELKGPASPENEESSPPRGKSEDTQLETPLKTIQGGGEPPNEVDTIAAETLANIGANFRNLCWFAELVSSTDDSENMVMKLENALHLSHFNKAKGKGRWKRKSGKSGCAKARRYSKLSPSDVSSTILKQSAARKDQGVLQSWGEVRNRQGGRRRRCRAGISFSLAELASVKDCFPYNVMNT